MTAALHSPAQHMQQVCETNPQQVCRASHLQPPESLEGSVQQMQQAACLAGAGACCAAHRAVVGGADPLQEQLQRLRLTPDAASPSKEAPGQRAGQSDDGSISSSSSEDCCSSSSSSGDLSPARQQQLAAEDLPSSSAATNSQPGDEAAWEPLLQDNPDRFTLSPIQ